MSVRNWHNKVVGHIISEGGGYSEEDNMPSKCSKLGEMCLISKDNIMIEVNIFFVINFITFRYLLMPGTIVHDRLGSPFSLPTGRNRIKE